MTELPNGWAATSVAEFSDPLKYGYTASADHDADGPRFLRITDIQDGRVKWDSVPRCEIEDDKLENFQLKSGDIVFARTGGTVGKSFLIRTVPEPSVFASYLIKVSPCSGVHSAYLYWFFQSLNYWEQIALKKGGLQGNVNAKTLGSVELLLPPSNEQRRIVEQIEAMFDQIDHGVESLKKAKAILGLYRQSLLKAAFEGRLTANWRAQNADKLEDPETLLPRIQKERDTRYKAALDEWQDALTDWREGGEKGKKPAKPRREATPDAPMAEQRSWMKDIPPEWQWVQIATFGFVTKLAGFEYTKHVTYREDGDLPVIKAENAGRFGFKATDFSKVASSEVAMLTRSQLFGGELLMVFVGAGTGNIATVPSDQRYFLGPNIGMIRLETPDVLPTFVEHYLRSPVGTAMKLASVKAVAQPSLSMGTIRQIPVALPCLAEQAEITRILDERLSAADAMTAEIDAGLTRAEALRHSILKQAFSGKLVPQDPTDEPASVLLERIKAESEAAPKTKRRRKSHA
ncbi:MAG: hypothetical protein BM560_20135 [Roseobacter sp. MedPE-SWde]|nr:MAG: hypothetical protein BM560_20135 [Roseobacter sp. MedPE-SWde]